MTQTVPSATIDFDAAMRQLASEGACIISDVLCPGTLEEVHDVLYRCAANDLKYGWYQQFHNDDGINQRIWNLPSRDPVFCDLVEHPVALRVVKHLLGWPALLSSMSANITGPGGTKMMLHADQGYVPEPWVKPWVVNIGWCIDDFTADNGATLYAPGSHLWNRNALNCEEPPDMVPAIAQAGSLLIMDGRLWHCSGDNRSNSRRAAIFAVYSLPILMPQENHFLSLNPAMRQFGSETLQTLFGFRPEFLGRVNGLDRL